MGIYQARVVLVVLATELALKFLWEHDKNKPANKDHKIDKLFNDLSSPLRCQVQLEYEQLAKSAPIGWRTVGDVFTLCRDASVQWRYLVEESNFPDYIMRAQCLIHATESVLRVSAAASKEK